MLPPLEKFTADRSRLKVGSDWRFVTSTRLERAGN